MIWRSMTAGQPTCRAGAAQAHAGLLTTHVGFILDYASELFHRELRRIAHYGSLWEQWFQATPGQWSARDIA